ncbi:MAG: phage holin family protein [Candidatus Eremiobacteraeota bacterium]|nr:phage holin family protein [Candidatus Eremiobacteraeota bacterium]
MDRKGDAPAYADLPLPELLRQLSTDTATLVRQEMQLARAEITQKGKQAQSSVTGFGTAALAGLGAFGALTTFLIALLADWLQRVWLAALIVAVIYGVVAFVAARSGKKALEEVGSPIPTQTVETVKEDVDAVRAGVRRAR